MERTVLVIDDMPRIAATVSFMLQRLGFETFRAGNGEQGLQLASDERPQLILLDIMMPRMNGYQACAAIKNIASDYHPEIWFLTGRGSEWDRSQAQSLGVSRVITKPFDPDVLSNMVREYFENWQTRETEQEAA
jgi:DNA-binding response OmpR family regulator